MVNLWGLVGKYKGAVVKVEKVGERLKFRDGARHKGWSQRDFAFNRDCSPPRYNITLQASARSQITFTVASDSPPEIGDMRVYSKKPGAHGFLFD